MTSVEIGSEGALPREGLAQTVYFLLQGIALMFEAGALLQVRVEPAQVGGDRTIVLAGRG